MIQNVGPIVDLINGEASLPFEGSRQGLPKQGLSLITFRKI